MKVKFTKDWSGTYGIFTKGRECELSGPMLAACPRDAIEEVKDEEVLDIASAAERLKSPAVSLSKKDMPGATSLKGKKSKIPAAE